MAGRALDGLRLRGGGPYNNAEIRRVVADLLGLKFPRGVMRLDRAQCRELVLRLIVLGLA